MPSVLATATLAALLVFGGTWLLNDTRFGVSIKCRFLNDQWACLSLFVDEAARGVANASLTRESSKSGVTALQVGDCIDEPPEASTITEVQHQPCNKPHDGEVFAVLTNPAGADEPYPVVSGFDDYIQTNCIPLWEAYTGRSWADDTEIDLNYLHPTLSGWGDGDRGFTCYLTRLDGGKLNASVKGIGASPLP